MKDVDDTKSNHAGALVVEPSEAITQTWQVVNKTHQWRPLNCDGCDVTLPGAFSDKDGDAFVWVWGLGSLSKWSQVWWGLRHFRDLWMEGNCFKMWLGWRQFRQNPCCYRKVTICWCGELLNFLQAYKGCLPSLQTTHRSSTLTVYDCVCG